MVFVTSDFESGSIEVLHADRATDIRLNIVKDNQACTRQWFYFKVQTDEPGMHCIRLMNADEASFPGGWKDYQAFASYDQITWFRVDTHCQTGPLTIRHDAREKQAYYAYFVPYPQSRHQELLAAANELPHIEHRILGQTDHNQNIDLLSFGKPGKNKKQVWLIAKQHPGETMAQWLVDGSIRELMANEEMAKHLLAHANIHIVANMNPDGSLLGNHRTNGTGINLNRQWQSSNPFDSPEVFFVRDEMHKTGVDLFVDVHGDEEIPHNFIMVNGDQQRGVNFKRRLADINGHFQLLYDYDNHPSACATSCCDSSCGGGKFAMATDYVYGHFNALSMLLELSFKPIQVADKPVLWGPEDCIRLGKDLIECIAQHVEGEIQATRMLPVLTTEPGLIHEANEH